jgi:hypothetical protein
MGNQLFKQVLSLTGIQEDSMAEELDSILGRAGVDKNEMTLDQLRQALMDYLTELHLEMEANCLQDEESDQPAS